jgi:hypothetical protein
VIAAEVVVATIAMRVAGALMVATGTVVIASRAPGERDRAGAEDTDGKDRSRRGQGPDDTSEHGLLLRPTPPWRDDKGALLPGTDGANRSPA